MNLEERLRLATQKRIDEGTLASAAILVQKSGEQIANVRCGRADIAVEQPLAAHTLYRLASMTKPITATAVMQLVERGLLRLDAPVADYLPSFAHTRVLRADGSDVPCKKLITLRHLLTHSSGLGSGNVFYQRFAPAFASHDGDTLEARVPSYAECPLEFEPGAGASYSARMAFDTLALLVQLASGLSFADYVARYITAPLGMPDTTCRPTAAQKERTATAYAATEHGLEPVDIQAREGFDGSVFQSGAGSYFGTAEDYARFAEMLLLDGKDVLKPASVRQMRTAQLPPSLPGLRRGENWGLGMRVVTMNGGDAAPLPEGAFGWSGAYGTHFWVDPSSQLICVYFANMTTLDGAAAVTAREAEACVYASERA